MAKPADAVTVVIPVHNATEALGKILPGWRVVLEKTGRGFEILVVDDGSTDAPAVERVATREPHTRVLRHDARRGFGKCLRTALAETRHPLFFYTALDYPYTPSDIRTLLERIEVRDEFLNRQPDLISGCRTGLAAPALLTWGTQVWRLFWRAFGGLPIPDPTPWHGWPAFWYRVRAKWVYGVPLTDVNSCFKLFRTAFLRRFPIQSDGDFVHTELVAKATFLTSIMDEVPLTAKPDPVPPVGDTSADRKRVFRDPEFAFPPEPPQPGEPGPPVADAPGSPGPAPPTPGPSPAPSP